MRVRDLDGRTWRVGRRWLPWRRWLRNVPDLELSGFDLPDLAGVFDDLPGVLAFLVLLLGVILLVITLPFLLLAIGAMLELSLLVALLPVVVLIRVALRRPWIVQVVGPDGALVSAEPVVGWRQSGERVAALAGSLREHRSGTGDASAEGATGTGDDGTGDDATGDGTGAPAGTVPPG